MCLPTILSPVFMFAFIFHRRSFLPCWPLAFLIISQPLWIFSSSFSVIHVSANIKNNVEKDTTLLLFFLSKRPGGHAISFQIKPCVAFGLPSGGGGGWHDSNSAWYLFRFVSYTYDPPIYDITSWKPEFHPITSSRYYSLSNVWIDRPLMPSSDVTTPWPKPIIRVLTNRFF